MLNRFCILLLLIILLTAKNVYANDMDDKSSIHGLEQGYNPNDGRFHANPRRRRRNHQGMVLIQGDMMISHQQILHHFLAESSSSSLLDNEKLHGHGYMIDDDNYSELDEITRKKRRLSIGFDNKYLWNIRDDMNRTVIPYVLDNRFTKTMRDIIISALKKLSARVDVIAFVDRVNQKDYLNFTYERDDGCWSSVGRQGGMQVLNLGLGCIAQKTIQHEVLHSLGFYHEHDRSDRDNYINILWDNIVAGMESDFIKLSSNTLGLEYDYKSIMHYGETYFGKNSASCTQTPRACNRAYLLKYKGNNQDGVQKYCIDVPDGYEALKDGLPALLTLCGTNNFNLQQWVFENYDNTSVIVKLAVDQTYCLTANFTSNVEGTPLIIQKCKPENVTFPYQYQRFQIHSKTWSEIILRWDGDNFYCASRNAAKLSLTKDRTPLIISFCDTLDHIFSVENKAYQTGFCESVNAYCSMGSDTLKTIESHGNVIGNSDLSPIDVTQVQLTYQCLGGPRNITSFCSPDCKCKRGQGSCTTNQDCKDGLLCRYDGKSMNRCLEATFIPTKSKTPTASPTSNPRTKKPSATPTTKKPVQDPTKNPTKVPSRKPTKPTISPTSGKPTFTPTSLSPSKNPTRTPTSTPSITPSRSPTKSPTRSPSNTPTTTSPTSVPTTTSPTHSPSKKPTNTPSETPTKVPTIDPTHSPTRAPTTSVPTSSPSTPNPTLSPTKKPTNNPTVNPTKSPTTPPTTTPTRSPTVDPTHSPSQSPTNPTVKPTYAPSLNPTPKPTLVPTVNPTHLPTINPTIKPSSNPTANPTKDPTLGPTDKPTKDPTKDPTITPTSSPAAKPTINPTLRPTLKPTKAPLSKPTTKPTGNPTRKPKTAPTSAPTKKPSKVPTKKPSKLKTFPPSKTPTRSPTPALTAPTYAPTTPTQSPILSCSTDDVSTDCGCSHNITITRATCPNELVYVCSNDQSFTSVTLGSLKFCQAYSYMAPLWGEGLCGNDPSKNHLLVFSTGKTVLYLTKRLNSDSFSTSQTANKSFIWSIGTKKRWFFAPSIYMNANNLQCTKESWSLSTSTDTLNTVDFAAESYANVDYGCSCASTKD